MCVERASAWLDADVACRARGDAVLLLRTRIAAALGGARDVVDRPVRTRTAATARHRAGAVRLPAGHGAEALGDRAITASRCRSGAARRGRRGARGTSGEADDDDDDPCRSGGRVFHLSSVRPTTQRRAPYPLACCSDDCVNPICMRLPTREGQRRTGTGTGIQQFRSFMPSDRFQPVRASSGRSIARTTRSARGVRQTMVEPTRPGGSLPGGRAARALAFGERKNRDASVAVASPPAALPVRARSTMVRRTSVPRPWSRPCQENGHSRS